MKADWMTALREQFGDTLRERVPMAPLTSLKVGGPARGFLTAASPNDLKKALGVLRACHVPLLILGRGTNLLVRDEGFGGLVIRLKGNFETIQPVRKTKNNVYLRAGAGVPLPRLLAYTVKNGLSGLEPLAGIPGTVGGALVMNAGIPGFSISEAISSITTLTPEGTFIKRYRRQLRPTYRHMGLPEREIVLHATFRLTPTEKGTVRRRIRDYLKRRQGQAWGRFPTAGSVFKNPEGAFAGKLIEACGLKGRRIGDAQVSPDHANIIVNRGKATAREVLDLITLIRDVVARETGITLETEVVIAGQ